MELSVNGVYGEACSEHKASHLIVIQLTWTKVMGKPGQWEAWGWKYSCLYLASISKSLGLPPASEIFHFLVLFTSQDHEFVPCMSLTQLVRKTHNLPEIKQKNHSVECLYTKRACEKHEDKYWLMLSLNTNDLSSWSNSTLKHRAANITPRSQGLKKWLYKRSSWSLLNWPYPNN